MSSFLESFDTPLKKTALGFAVVAGLFLSLIIVIVAVADNSPTSGTASTKEVHPNAEIIRPQITQADPQKALGEMIAFGDIFNAEVGESFFVSASIKQEGRRLEFTVSDIWYQLPDFQQERLIESFGKRYAVIAATNGLREPEANEANYPTTSFVDSFGKEVAFQSTFRTRIVE